MVNSARIFLLAVALTASACTPLNRGDQPLSPEETRLRAIEGKLTEVARRVNIVENKDDTRIQDEMRTLRGEIERLRFDVDAQDKRSKELYLDVDRRMQKLESAASNLAVPPADSTLGNGIVAPPISALPDNATAPNLTVAPRLSPAAANNGTSAEEEAVYLKAFDSLKAGKYDVAITGFRGMLDRWPQGNFSDNGWYWMGEANYVKRQYQPALDAFNSLLVRFPASPKVPDALFKGGLAQWELNQREAAKAAWRRVIRDYPTANAAGLARQRLEQAK